MPRRGRDGGAARASAADSVPNPRKLLASMKQADVHDRAALARLGRDHYTRPPLKDEFHTPTIISAFVVRGALGSFSRYAFDQVVTPDQVEKLLPEVRLHVAEVDLCYSPQAKKQRGRA